MKFRWTAGVSSYRQLNRPFNDSLQRLLHHAGATREVARDAGSLRCAACGDAVRTSSLE